MKKVVKLAAALLTSIILSGCSGVFNTQIETASDSTLAESARSTTTTTSTLNASSLTHGTYTSSVTSGIFTVYATSSKTVSTPYVSKTYNSLTFTQKLALGGAGSYGSYRCVGFTVSGTATVTCYADGASGRYLALVNSSGTTVSKNAVSSSIATYTYSITSSGTYYLLSTASNINIYYISVAATSSSSSADFSATSVAFAKKLTAGWNLGNTMEAYSDGTNQYCQDLYSETCWGMPTTTQAMITGIKNAGFKAIRIPITWHNHIYDSTNYTIDSTWMSRVKTVVDYAYNAGLYVIINVHHDNLSASEYGTTAYNSRKVVGYVLNSSYTTVSETYLQKVWTQIAEEFADYDQHLVFEVLNEPRDVGGTYEWWVSGTTATTYNNLVTEYENTCISAIRATGGNNTSRYLMVPAYAGSTSFLSTYTMPTDTASDKLILSVHAYSPYNFAMYNSSSLDTTFDTADKTELNSMFSTVYSSYVANGTGVVIGEASASNKNNLAERVKWATYYFGTAYGTYGMPTILWDNGAYSASTTSGEQHGYYNRSAQTWYFPTIISAALSAVGITPGTLTQS